jgi:hypothetical protein
VAKKLPRLDSRRKPRTTVEKTPLLSIDFSVLNTLPATKIRRFPYVVYAQRTWAGRDDENDFPDIRLGGIARDSPANRFLIRGFNDSHITTSCSSY